MTSAPQIHVCVVGRVRTGSRIIIVRAQAVGLVTTANLTGMNAPPYRVSIKAIVRTRPWMCPWPSTRTSVCALRVSRVQTVKKTIMNVCQIHAG
eukprot:SAG31_NODE_40386_length_281_cov_0.593407_1_plen_93_part_11